jgi:hypothetical protein
VSLTVTVRYPNGLVVKYNNAHFLRYGADGWHLYTNSKEEQWIATIMPSAGVTVEQTPACSVTQSNPEYSEIRSMKQMFFSEMEGLRLAVNRMMRKIKS